MGDKSTAPVFQSVRLTYLRRPPDSLSIGPLGVSDVNVVC